LHIEGMSRAHRGHVEGVSRARRRHIEGARARKNPRFFLPHVAKSGQSFSSWVHYFPFFPSFSTSRKSSRRVPVYNCISRSARARKNQRFFLPHALKSGQSFSFFGPFFSPFFPPFFPLVDRVPDVYWCTILYRGALGQGFYHMRQE